MDPVIAPFLPSLDRPLFPGLYLLSGCIFTLQYRGKFPGHILTLPCCDTLHSYSIAGSSSPSASVSSLILEGGSAPSDGVAVAAPCKCVGCSADVATSSYAQIVGGRDTSSHGCMHTVCMQCFGLAHALCSADIKLKCPRSSCAYQSRRWIIHSPVASRTGDTESSMLRGDDTHT